MLQYFFLFPYTTFGISFLTFGSLSLRLLRTRLIESKLRQLEITCYIIFYLINTFILRYLFDFGVFILFTQNAIVFGLSWFLVKSISIIGITGQICSGKSTVVDYLKSKYKAVVIEIDQLNREVLGRKEVLDEIHKVFGDEVFKLNENTCRKELDKAKVREIIYQDKKKKRKLEAITHPRVFLNFFYILFYSKFVKKSKYVFVENAILLRFFIFKLLCQRIISVCVKDKNELIKRIVARDNSSTEAAENILKNQMSVDKFVKESTDVIWNEGTEEDLYQEVDNIVELLK